MAADPTPDTRTRILDTAESLFAEQGFEATSLRQVTREAEVNLAAVHYHFGSKLDLLRAVLERRVVDVNRERLAGLAALEAEAGGTAPPLECVLEVFLAAPLRAAAREPGHPGLRNFVVLVGRLGSSSGPSYGAFEVAFREGRERFFPALRRAVPHVSDEDFGWRLRCVIGSLCAPVTAPSRPRLGFGAADPVDAPEEALAQLVAFCAAGLRAPSPAGSEAGRGTGPETGGR
jgi:AcrR family transcriptional regulator